jgi:hypothetical protein
MPKSLMKKPKPIKMKNTIARIDREDFDTLADKQPEIIKDIQRELDNEKTPRQISAFIKRLRPHRWPLAQMIEGAARHLQREDSR